MNVLLTSICTASTSLAHAGHGTSDPDSAMHYAIEWVHVAPWLLAAAVAILALRARRRSRSTRPRG